MIVGSAVGIAEERRQLGIALHPATMAAYLGEAFFPAGAAGKRPVPPECRILDVKYEPRVCCSILYRFGDRLVRGQYRWGPQGGEAQTTSRLIEPLGLRVCYFEEDPSLPGLASAVSPGAASDVLRRALPECRNGEAQVVRCRPTLLRYRPGRRCTLRYDVWLRARAGGVLRRLTLYGKVYHDLAKAESVHEAMSMLADSRPVREGRLTTARVVAFLPELRLILQEPIAGTPLELLLGGLRGTVTAGDRRGWEGVLRSGAALAALHTCSLSARRDRPIAAELARFVKRAVLAVEADARIGERLGDLAAALPAWLPKLREWGERITLVHGDAKPGQCLVTRDGVALLDFDHCGMADAATDVGTYLASLRQRAVQQGSETRGRAAGRKSWLLALEGAFLDEYCRASGSGEAFRLRASWYEAVALLRKAYRAFARSPRSPLPLALVDEGWRTLANLPAP